MAHKPIHQASLGDSLLIEHRALMELDGIHELIDWKRIEALLRGIHASDEGNLAYPPILKFKALLLQAWYELSDPALEKQLARDLLFRRFVGIGIADEVPYHTTFHRFRAELEANQLFQTLLAEINAQLTERKVIIQTGRISIIDASVSEALRARPNKDKDGNNTQDSEAGWSVKTGSDGKRDSTYGFKNHLNVEEDGFIIATEITAGNVHDSNVFEQLIDEHTQAAYADEAYPSKKRAQWLTEHGIDNRILHKAYRNQPLTPKQRTQNRVNSGACSMVEGVFGILKQYYGMRKAKCIGQVRNHVRFNLVAMAYNLKRALKIVTTTVG